MPLPHAHMPQVQVGAHAHDFTWLQSVLKQRGVKLTSDEVGYQLQSKVAAGAGASRVVVARGQPAAVCDSNGSLCGAAAAPWSSALASICMLPASATHLCRPCLTCGRWRRRRKRTAAA